MKFIQGQNRNQIHLFPVSLDQGIDPDNEIRVIDLFVESLSIKDYGFRTVFPENGRPAYHPADLLRLFIYGYLNKIRSSRDLEKECKRNIEVMWLFSPGYEKEVTVASTRELHYINSPYGLVAILIKQGTTTSVYYTETDHLGSIVGLLNADGSYAEQFSFDAWGRRRNPLNWTYASVPQPVLISRGYTGHEHLDAFGLVDMNGRMYDPVLGRFLGVDPLIQTPDNSQSINGYSYCLNNPLKYTDPSGYYQRPYSYENDFQSNYVESWVNYQDYLIYGSSYGSYYYYSLTSGKYYHSSSNRSVSYSEVYYNYAIPHSIGTLNGDEARKFVWDLLSIRNYSSLSINNDNLEIIEKDFLGIKGLLKYSIYPFPIDLTREDYEKSGGVYVKLGYESTTGKWVQIASVSDMTSPFIDTNLKNSYYYPNQWVKGNVTIFEDWPCRPYDCWFRGDLFFEVGGEFIFHLNWGFNIKDGKTTLIPFKVVKPVPFEYFMEDYPY